MEKSVKKVSIVNISVCALFTAFTCVAAQILIPTPWGVPFTLQTLAVALCGFALGTKRGTVSVIAYVLLGAFGVPVFSGFKGGIGALFGITGGYIYGFLFLALLCGFAGNTNKTALKFVFAVSGVLLCHICGTAQLAAISKSTFFAAFITASAPFLLKDFLSCLAACIIAEILKKRTKLI